MGTVRDGGLMVGRLRNEDGFDSAMGAVKLSKRTIDALSVERGDKVFWDRALPGFGIRVHATGRKIYVAQARTPGGLPKRVPKQSDITS